MTNCFGVPCKKSSLFLRKCSTSCVETRKSLFLLPAYSPFTAVANRQNQSFQILTFIHCFFSQVLFSFCSGTKVERENKSFACLCALLYARPRFCRRASPLCFSVSGSCQLLSSQSKAELGVYRVGNLSVIIVSSE